MPPLTKEELWSSGQDEDVEVNQRALIDSKVYLPYLFCLPLHSRLRLEILARYSGEHTSKPGSSLLRPFHLLT